MSDVLAVATAVGLSGFALVVVRSLLVPLVFGLYDQIKAR
jgi:hypothetical protein